MNNKDKEIKFDSGRLFADGEEVGKIRNITISVKDNRSKLSKALQKVKSIFKRK